MALRSGRGDAHQSLAKTTSRCFKNCGIPDDLLDGIFEQEEVSGPLGSHCPACGTSTILNPMQLCEDCILKLILSDSEASLRPSAELMALAQSLRSAAAVEAATQATRGSSIAAPSGDHSPLGNWSPHYEEHPSPAQFGDLECGGQYPEPRPHQICQRNSDSGACIGPLCRGRDNGYEVPFAESPQLSGVGSCWSCSLTQEAEAEDFLCLKDGLLMLGSLQVYLAASLILLGLGLAFLLACASLYLSRLAYLS